MKHPLFVRFLSTLLAASCSVAFAQAAPNVASEDVAPAEPVKDETTVKAQPIKLAFILPRKKSRFDAATQYALDGALAANYAAPVPAEILLIRPGSDDSVAKQLKSAAASGALAAIGPLDRDAIEQIAQMDYLPLPVVTLNQIDLDKEVPLTQEEIQEQRMKEEARQIADDAARELNEAAQAQQDENAPTNPEHLSEGELAAMQGGSISVDLKVPGLVLAKDIPVEHVRYEPRLFPRGLLMTSLSLETDAHYVAELGVQALPRLTESGERPKVLVIDQDKPLQKRIANSFSKTLTDLGYAPDRLTVDLKDLNRVSQLFELVIEDDDPEIEPDEPIDQEADPVAWRQQQLRQTRESAERRAYAALAEPPYYAVFLALDAATASQIRPRLPLRTRLWGTSLLYPGNPETNSTAKALTFDLKQVGFVDAPFILDFDDETFDATYKVAPPASLVGKQLFALGVDALSIANAIAQGKISGEIEGLTGSLQYDLESSPVVTRHGACAMINSGSIRRMTPQELIDFRVIQPSTYKALKKSEHSQAQKASPAQEAATEMPAAQVPEAKEPVAPTN